jgi:cytochrome c biogenesis protein CcmG/thiol:disulfide interchange protein DsbE
MKKIIIVFTLMTLVFGYAVIDALRVDTMLSSASNSFGTGSVITSIPESKFSHLGSSDELVSLRSIVGADKKILVHFWATWCAPCEVEFPELVEAINLLSYDENIAFVLVAIDDKLKEIKKFLKKFKIDSKRVHILEDKIDMHKRFGTYKLPESYLFGPTDQLIKKLPGKQPWMQSHILDLIKTK